MSRAKNQSALVPRPYSCITYSVRADRSILRPTSLRPGLKHRDKAGMIQMYGNHLGFITYSSKEFLLIFLFKVSWSIRNVDCQVWGRVKCSGRFYSRKCAGRFCQANQDVSYLLSFSLSLLYFSPTFTFSLFPVTGRTARIKMAPNIPRRKQVSATRMFSFKFYLYIYIYIYIYTYTHYELGLPVVTSGSVCALH